MSFDIFEFDVEERKFEELNKSLTSFLTTHLEEAQRPQKHHIAEKNDNIRQLSEPSPNIEQSYYDNFHNLHSFLRLFKQNTRLLVFDSGDLDNDSLLFSCGTHENTA